MELQDLMSVLVRLKPGQRMVISRVPWAEGHEDHFKIEPIPPQKMRELQATMQRKINGDD